jgi:hypothetical protein
VPGAKHKLRVVSYGGGVQSTALLVLAAPRVIDFPVFLMANVGHDSEDPDTPAYLHRYAQPYAENHGIQLQVIDRRRPRRHAGNATRTADPTRLTVIAHTGADVQWRSRYPQRHN